MSDHYREYLTFFGFKLFLFLGNLFMVVLLTTIAVWVETEDYSVLIGVLAFCFFVNMLIDLSPIRNRKWRRELEKYNEGVREHNDRIDDGDIH